MRQCTKMAIIRRIVRKYTPYFILNWYRAIKRELCKQKWRALNQHNGTILKNYVDISLISCGNYTYGDLNVLAFKGKSSKLTIGNFCSIASDVKFFLDGNHRMDGISTFPFDVRLFGEMPIGVGNGDINIGDDVWLGQRCMVMSGVTIGQGAVIGAGALVTKDVPPYAVAGGIPAKVIKYRFPDEVIEELLKIDYSVWTYSFIEKYRNYLDKSTSIEKIKEIVKLQNKHYKHSVKH